MTGFPYATYARNLKKPELRDVYAQLSLSHRGVKAEDVFRKASKNRRARQAGL